MKTRESGLSRLLLLISLMLAGTTWGQESLLQDRWLRLDTENFVFISQVSARETGQIANKLENWRQVAASTSGRGSFPRAPVPNYVYLFEDLESFQRFSYATESASFSPSPRANFMALVAGDDDSSTIGFHHYVHFLVRNFSDLRLPRWYEEGLAGYISRMQVDGDTIEVERFSAEENRIMAQLSETFSMDRLLYRDSALASPRVIQIANLKSETLLYYLLHGSEEAEFPDRRGQLQGYLDLLLTGRNDRFSFDQAFDVTTQQLDAEFANYLLTSARPRVTLQALTPRADREYDPVPLARGPLAILLAELALNSGQFEAAQTLFEAAKDAELARGYSGLGDALRMQELAGIDQLVSGYFDRAVSLSPDDATIQLDHGEYWESELLDCAKVWPAAQRSEILDGMQVRYTRALELNPESPEANLAMAQVFLFPEMDWQQGRPFQRRAFALLPADTFIMEQAARYAIAADDYDEAERLIDELAQPIHFWGEQEWVTALRERLLRKRRNEPYDECSNE